MHSHLRRVRGQFVQRCSHPRVVRPPEDSMPRPGFFVLSVPCVGEQVLTIHSWYLRVVAVGAQRLSPRTRGLGNTAPETRGCSPRQTATSPPDPRHDHACSRALTTAQRSRRITPSRLRTPVPLFASLAWASDASM